MFNTSFLHPVEKCQLCEKRNHQFTCNVCVLTGNFCPSAATNSPHHNQDEEKSSFGFKQKRLHVVKNVKDDYQKRLETELKKQNIYNEKSNHLILLRTKVDTLKLVLSEGKKQNIEDENINEQLSKDIKQRRELVQRLILKTEKIKTSLTLREKKLKLQRYKEKLSRKHEQLKQLRIGHVQMLVNDIFPLSERIVYPIFGTPPRGTISTQYVPCTDVVSESMSTATETELEEATRTIHVEGKWVSLSTEEKEFTIVDSGMPTSGDFIKYFNWLKSYRNEPRSTESNLILHHNEVMRIPAALFYSAQLTEGLAFFLDINVPHRIDLINFGLLQVSRKKLVRTINKLIENVMHLCFSQLVNEEQLESNAIIRNLKMCIESKHLGWRKAFETYDVKPIDCPFESDSSAEELNFDTDSDDYLGGDQGEWDSLKDIPLDHIELESPSPSFNQSRERSLSSSASGLVTSAAASLTSALWSWKRYGLQVVDQTHCHQNIISRKDVTTLITICCQSHCFDVWSIRFTELLIRSVARLSFFGSFCCA